MNVPIEGQGILPFRIAGLINADDGQNLVAGEAQIHHEIQHPLFDFLWNRRSDDDGDIDVGFGGIGAAGRGSEKDDAFDEWLSNYYESLDEDGKVKFIETYYGDVMDQGSPGDFDYAVELPQAIVDLANS